MNTHAHSCTHTATCSDGDLKLVGGISETEGRLEVCFGQRWGTIHGDGWTQADTQVACRQLGYSTSGMLFYLATAIRFVVCIMYSCQFSSNKLESLAI